MTNSLYRLRVSSQFSSSHQLRYYQGQCEHLHGHNFLVETEVEGDQLDPRTGLLLDFKELKRLLNSVLKELDHTHLNDLPPFREENPSSENLARYIFQSLKKILPYPNIRVREVSVAEKESSKAIYTEPL